MFHQHVFSRARSSCLVNYGSATFLGRPSVFPSRSQESQRGVHPSDSISATVGFETNAINKWRQRSSPLQNYFALKRRYSSFLTFQPRVKRAPIDLFMCQAVTSSTTLCYHRSSSALNLIICYFASLPIYHCTWPQRCKYPHLSAAPFKSLGLLASVYHPA